MYVPDNLDAYRAYEAEQNRRLKELPVCSHCEDYVQDDHYYLINDEVLCPQCLEGYFRKEIL